MRDFLRKLPFPVEFAVVLAGAFGYAVLFTLINAIQGGPGPLHSEPGMWRALALDAVVLAMLGTFLRLRGWNVERLGLQSHWMDGAWGVALAAGAYCAFYAMFTVVSAVAPELAQSAAKVAHLPHALSPWVIAAVILFGSFYEEFFVCGYVITALKEKGHLNTAINMSVALRLAFHLYQGVIGVVLIIPLGLLFAYWYAKSGRLWPVVVAHAALNLISFLPYVKF